MLFSAISWAVDGVEAMAKIAAKPLFLSDFCHFLVAEDRNHRSPHTQRPEFSAIFEKSLGITRYQPPLGWHMTHDAQISVTRAFARFLAGADHQGLRGSGRRRSRRRLKS